MQAYSEFLCEGCSLVRVYRYKVDRKFRTRPRVRIGSNLLQNGGKLFARGTPASSEKRKLLKRRHGVESREDDTLGIKIDENKPVLCVYDFVECLCKTGRLSSLTEMSCQLTSMSALRYILARRGVECSPRMP